MAIEDHWTIACVAGFLKRHRGMPEAIREVSCDPPRLSEVIFPRFLTPVV